MSDAPHPTDPAVMYGVIPYLAMAGRGAVLQPAAQA
jgi:hypothetical protein